MELTVLAVPGCPNAPVLEQRLAEALAGPAARYGTTAGAVLARLHAADFLRLGFGHLLAESC
jgi:hypothetical protein